MAFIQLSLICSILLSQQMRFVRGEAEPQNFQYQPELNGFIKLPQIYQKTVTTNQNYPGEF